MFDALIDFIQSIIDAITGLSSGLSSSAVTPEVPETTTPEVPEPPASVEPTPDPEVPGQEPIPGAATNPDDPRLN